jgi:hypothetical protein
VDLEWNKLPFLVRAVVGRPGNDFATWFQFAALDIQNYFLRSGFDRLGPGIIDPLLVRLAMQGSLDDLATLLQAALTIKGVLRRDGKDGVLLEPEFLVVFTIRAPYDELAAIGCRTAVDIEN